MVYIDDLIIFLQIAFIAFVIPGGLTILNIYNLFSNRPKRKRLASWLTIVIGGIFYLFLYAIAFGTAGDWYEAIYSTQTHYAISSQYGISVILPTMIGFIGLIVLSNVKSDKLPPLISALSIASVIVLNVIQIVFAIQISENIKGSIDLLLYVYHANIFILSVTVVRDQIRQQIEIYRGIEENNAETGTATGWLYRKIKNISNYTVLIFICLFFLISILEIVFILLGQGLDAPIRAFTDTADWTFSKQIPPPPLEYEGHYLCTVAAGGHKGVVKPLRYGTRRGATIVVNRQLCIANAFEEYIQEKAPVFHGFIRGVYDKYGYPISKHITTPIRADVVYVIMKPLEWLFLIFLYLFDIRPEQRISRQYL